MSEISGREDRSEREDGRSVGSAADRRGGPAKHIHAVQKRGDGCGEKNGFGPAPLQLGEYMDRGQHHEDAGDKQEKGEPEVAHGKGRRQLQPVAFGKIGHGAVSASLAAGAVLGCVVLFPVERALVQGLTLLAAYPCFGALFYVAYRRWGRRLGAARGDPLADAVRVGRAGGPAGVRAARAGAPAVPSPRGGFGMKAGEARPSYLLLPALAVLLAMACMELPFAHAQQVETPVATAFGFEADDDSAVTFAVAEPLPGSGGSLRIGFAVRCERPSGRLEALMSFGSVPAGKLVQAAVRTGDGRVERFGPVVRGGGPAAGFFDPKLTDRKDVLRLVDAAFSTGALTSNGHNSVWNRIGEEENRRARTALRRCAGAGE